MTRYLRFIVAVPLIMCSSMSRAETVLIKDGQDPCPIYVSAKPAPQEKKAAEELAAYLGKISGAKFDVRPVPSPLPERGMFVGRVDGAAADGLGPDAFRIRTQGQRLFIVGGNPQGTLYGVYAFLEQQLGCRWWSHNEEDVPSGQATIRVADLDRVTRPAFSIHNVWNREAQSPLNQFAAKARTTSWESFNGSHTLYPLLTPHAAKHPDIYPMDKEGQRKGNKLHFCYMAPNIAETLADALAKQAEARKGATGNVIYFAGMGDWYGGMCQCPTCQKIYDEETWTDADGRKKPGYTATLLRMINQSAEILERRYPGIRVGTFAYMSLEAPPAKTVPRKNVIIRVPRLRHCTVHPAQQCDKNRSYARNLERWCEIAPGQVYVWEYGASYKNFLCPFPCLFAMAGNLKYYHKIGIKGVEIQGNYVSTGGDLAVLKNYVWSKLFWNPELDPREVLRDFCKGYYGPAADDMLAYVETLEKSVVEPRPTHADEFAGFGYISAEVRTLLERQRTNALGRADGKQPYDRRVKEGTLGLEALALWSPGPLMEEGDKLVRRDLGRYTLPQAEELLKYVRDASPTEWSSGRAARLNFLTYHGGPLVTLTQGPVTVKVAPLLNGQIRQLSYRGKNLLHVENNPKVRGYPLVGGSLEAVGTRMMSLADDPTGRKVKMVGESGIGLFASGTQQTIWKTIALADDGSIAVNNSVRRVVAASDQRSATVSTVYAAGKGLANVQLEYRTRDNRWEKIDLAGDQTERPLPALNAVRIGLPEQECIVVDHYDAPEILGGKITVDSKTGTLTIVVNSAAVEAPMQGEKTFLKRRIQAGPLPDK